ncbi:MAG TPA: hypothetical protein VGB72_01085 [Acidobacteriota bacterium]
MKKILSCPIKQYFPEPLKIENRFIPVIHSISKLNIPEKFPEIDTWAVPIHKVMNLSGAFRSADLKDYLGLPADRKLILSTCAPDSYQEILWEKGADLDYKKYHIDYWFPAHFSIYDNDSKLYQFISAKRQQLHAALTESQFVWFRLGENIPLDYFAPIKKAPSVLISTGQMYSPENREILNEEFKSADRWFPKSTSFFIIGGTTWLSVPSKRSCFDISSNWLIRGIKGRNLNGNKVENRSKRDVLISNLKDALITINTLYV